MEMESPPQCPPTVTIRRNPHRKARDTPSSAVPLPELLSSPPPPRDIPSYPLRDILFDESADNPKILPDEPVENTGNLENSRRPAEVLSENLKIYLRVRPMDIQRHGVQPKTMMDSKNTWPRNPKVKINSRPKWKKCTETCVQINDDLHSVTVLTPQALQETKRIKSEAYEGFSHVFSPEVSQTEVYEKMMNPLVEDFLNGKSGLLAAMGPTGSGKTHTVFGCAREPGMVPLALRQIFSKNENHGTQSRIFSLSMFEICSEKGKAERIVDLLHDGGDICMQQSIIRGLQEVVVCDSQQAELLIAQGMLKRSTAMTNSNSQSSRSQCIINIQCGFKKRDEDVDGESSTSMLSIVDLAGAEKEKKTGNQGARLIESNFINNTSMVFGLCLRSLLEHQKNRTKPLHKHYQNSLLTRYLRDYLVGKKRMMLILTVKPGIEDYLDTSFMLRQASPFNKIKFKSIVESVNLTCSKRANQAYSRAKQHKKLKICSGEPDVVEGRIDGRNLPLTTLGISMKVVKDGLSQKSEDIHDVRLTEVEVLSEELVSKEISGKSSSESHCVMHKNEKDRKYQIMQGFSKALWNVLKQYKKKLEEAEIERCHLRDRLTNEQTKNCNLQKELTQERMKLCDLENELKQLKSDCMCHGQVRDSSLTFASSGEVEEHCHQLLEAISESLNDAQDATGYKNNVRVDMQSRKESPPVSTDDSEDGFKEIGILDLYSPSESTSQLKSACHDTSHGQDATGCEDTSILNVSSKPECFSVNVTDVEDGRTDTARSHNYCPTETAIPLENAFVYSSHVVDVEDDRIDTGRSDNCRTTETAIALENACLYSSHECEQADGNVTGDAKNLKPESQSISNGYCPDTSLESESKSTTQDYENVRYVNTNQTQLASMERALSKAESPQNSESCFLAEEEIGILDLYSPSESSSQLKSACHDTSHGQDATGCEDTSILNVSSEPECFSVNVTDVEDGRTDTARFHNYCPTETAIPLENASVYSSHVVDVEDGRIDTGRSDNCRTTETAIALENACLYSSRECEQADRNVTGDAKNLKPESQFISNGYCPDTSLESESKSTTQDYENVRYVNTNQMQLASMERALSKVESPQNSESCFLAEEEQLSNEKWKHNTSTVLPKEGWDESNKSELVTKLTTCNNFKHTEKPKRRLLPASSVLLKDISSLEVKDEEDKPKGVRGAKRVPMDETNRTQGSVSLLRLLRTKLDR